MAFQKMYDPKRTFGDQLKELVIDESQEERIDE